MNGEITLKDLYANARTTPQKISLEILTLQFHQDKYPLFVALIEKAIGWCAKEMAKNKNITGNLDEDSISTIIGGYLKSMGFFVYHDANQGGHCDLSIEYDDDLLWLAEAKKFTSYGKLYGGFQQLVDRYSSGLKGQDRGGFLIYILDRDAKSILIEWIKYLSDNFSGIKCDVDHDELSAYSTHAHSGSGREIGVRHLPFVLLHAPTDTQKPPKRKALKKAA
jgi:hypothetical protein